MFDAIVTVIIKIVEMIEKGKLSKQERSTGCKGLYQMYSLLVDVIELSEDLLEQMDSYLSQGGEKTWQKWEVTKETIESIYLETIAFAALVENMANALDIFDEELTRRLLIAISLDIEVGWELQVLYKAIDRTLRKQKKLLDFLPSQEVDLKIGLADPLWFISKGKDLEKVKEKMLKNPKREFRPSSADIVDFNDEQSLLRFRNRAETNLKELRAIQLRLAFFIQENCEFKDLF